MSIIRVQNGPDGYVVSVCESPEFGSWGVVAGSDCCDPGNANAVFAYLLSAAAPNIHGVGSVTIRQGCFNVLQSHVAELLICRYRFTTVLPDPETRGAHVSLEFQAVAVSYGKCLHGELTLLCRQ